MIGELARGLFLGVVVELLSLRGLGGLDKVDVDDDDRAYFLPLVDMVDVLVALFFLMSSIWSCSCAQDNKKSFEKERSLKEEEEDDEDKDEDSVTLVAVEENDERDTDEEEEEEEEEEGEEETSFRGLIVEEGKEGRGILGDMGACEITSLSLTHSLTNSSWGYFWGLHLLMQEPIVVQREGDIEKI